MLPTTQSVRYLSQHHFLMTPCLIQIRKIARRFRHVLRMHFQVPDWHLLPTQKALHDFLFRHYGRSCFSSC